MLMGLLVAFLLFYASLFNEITRTIPLRLKDYEKQEKKLKELKASGSSKKKAESKQKEALTR